MSFSLQSYLEWCQGAQKLLSYVGKFLQRKRNKIRGRNLDAENQIVKHLINCIVSSAFNKRMEQLIQIPERCIRYNTEQRKILKIHKN